MGLPDTIQLEAASSRTSGISSQSVSNGAGYAGSAIDNSTNLDGSLTLELTFVTGGTAPTADDPLEVYVIYSDDGTNYEGEISAGGSISSKPPSHCLVGSFPAEADTSTTHRRQLREVPLLPKKFLIAVWNGSDQSQTFTVDASTFNRAVTD